MTWFCTVIGNETNPWEQNNYIKKVDIQMHIYKEWLTPCQTWSEKKNDCIKMRREEVSCRYKTTTVDTQSIHDASIWLGIWFGISWTNKLEDGSLNNIPEFNYEKFSSATDLNTIAQHCHLQLYWRYPTYFLGDWNRSTGQAIPFISSVIQKSILGGFFKSYLDVFLRENTT